jgi:hypothetical protein
MRKGNIALVVAGVLASLIGFGLLAGGSVLVWAHTTQRDSAGFYTTPTGRFETSTFAVTSKFDFGTEPQKDDSVWWSDGLGRVRLRATSPSSERAVFLGIAPQADVDRWLAGTGYQRVEDAKFDPFRTTGQTFDGPAPATPGSQAFWVASSTGTGTRSLEWKVRSGQWAVVLMNADASAAVAADVSVGVKTGLVLPIGLGLGGFGLVLLIAGIAMMAAGAMRSRVVDVRPGVPLPDDEPLPAGAYPARLDGRLQPVSRWLWLVKFILVIPHMIVLSLLWIAVSILTVVAGFSILFTGRYPRSFFDFNVGVMRWTWRVGFYSFAAFGTDAYPPFSLEKDPSYAAHFDVAYPERLSRPLVLVKWWLLALPHLLIVGVLAGGVWFGRNGGAPGLIGVLGFVAALVLAVTGRYPTGLFDFVMGLNRWVGRVAAYVMLMTDEYPPFRLDAGGADPGTPLSGTPEPPPPDDHSGLDDLQGVTVG